MTLSMVTFARPTTGGEAMATVVGLVYVCIGLGAIGAIVYDMFRK